MKSKISVISISAIISLCLLQTISYAADAKAAKTASAPAETKKTGNASKTKAIGTASLASLGTIGKGEEITAGSVGRGASLSPLLSESFQTDLATGSATAAVPFVVPPGRKNMQPSLALSYSSNNPTGVCGAGWGLATSSIQRSTKRGIPRYDISDTFVFASSGSSGDLVLSDAARGEFRQKIETAFMKYVFDNAGSKWTVWDKAGAKYTFGSSTGSRLENTGGTKVFAWYLDRVEDVYGNAVIFTYEKDGGQIYLSKIYYTVNDSVAPPLIADKEIDLVYESGRPDITYSNRTGWNIQTAKRLKEAQIKVDGAIVWRYLLDYKQSVDTKRSLLTQVTLFDAAGNSLPPKKFTYQTVE